MNIFYRSILYLFLLLLANQLKAQDLVQSNGKEIALDEVKISSKKERRERKQIEKLKNPKWLKVVGEKGFFTDNKSAYIANNSFEARQQYNGRALNQSREELVYGNIGINRSGQFDYDRLETKVIQLALFRPELEELEIKVAASCDGYQDIQYLFLIESDLKLLRKVNTIENFIKGFKVTDPTVFRKMEFITNTLCQ